jgi:hypothetical protein
MALATITGKDGTADFTIGSQSYRTVLDMFRIREIIELVPQDVFSIEGVADQEAGRSQIVGECTGLGKKGAVQAGPLIPAPQDVAQVLTFSTGCFLTLSTNWSEFSADRLVNTNMRIGGRFVSKATYALTWVVS